ncbi:hypothetical protein FRC18_008631 [Serendipita sp. 400]|nr:hypothetical protein FRC18_008631 [Serendipita sp. 400]
MTVSSSSDSEKSESSDSSSSSSSSSSAPKNKAVGIKSLQNGHPTAVADTIKSKPTSLSDKSSTTSDSDSDEEVTRVSLAATSTQTKNIRGSSGSHINGNKSLPKEQVNEPDVVGVEKVVKRQRTEDGDKTTQTEALTVKTEVSQVKVSNKGKQRGGVPFQRIKGDKVAFADERLKDNTFAARGGTMDDYGAKASADLIVTRGSGFRKEKNKKKRGSYRGGEITLQSHSIKFE